MSDNTKCPTDDLALCVSLDGVQQIEASAGTGKTYTIAGLYVRLIVERKLELREILVMTFTKAATAELRQRLRERLSLCAELATSPWLDAPPDIGLSAEQVSTLTLLRRVLAAGETPDELARRLKLAVLGMDEAAIFTIHGFCDRVLREHAVLVDGASGDIELEPDDGDLLEEFARDAWLRIAADEDKLLREALLKLGKDPEALSKTLKGLVDFGGRMEPARPAAELTTPKDEGEAREQVFAAWAGSAIDAVAMFEGAFTAGEIKLTNFKRGSVEELHDLAWQLGARKWPAPEQLAKFAGTRIAAGMKKSAAPFPGHPAFDAIDKWCEVHEARLEAVRARVPLVLHELVDGARKWLTIRKRALARISYADQIELVYAGLSGDPRGARLLKALRKQYPVALVDEFQDTDARQFEIFARLYRGFGTLFCIGDPKQAIYGFRGGDVHVYLRAKKLAQGQARLDKNFRSSPGMLAASNALFQAHDEVFMEEKIKFDPVAWGDKTQAGELCHAGKPVVPMTFWQLPETPEKGGKDAVAQSLAKACASQIAQLLAPGATTLKTDPLQPEHIAVLVNSNKEAILMQDALSAHGVPAVCLRRESVFASVEAGELRQVLDALLLPRDARAARGALATRLLGRSLANLAAMQGDEVNWRAELDDLRGRWLERGVLAMLERLGEKHAPRLLAQPGGERCLSNLMQLGDALQAEARRLASPHAQRDWLAQRIADADEHNEAEQLRLESDADRVQIMTLHVAKGLEFELVFLPFAAMMGAREAKAGEPVCFHDEDGQLVQRFLGCAVQDDQATADSTAVAKALMEDKAEGVRKLYVGVTRAKHACWLSIGKPSTRFKDGVLDWVLPDGAASLLKAAKGDIRICDVPEVVQVQLAAEALGSLPTCRSFTRSMDRDWWVHSFSRLSDGPREPGVITGAEVMPEVDSELLAHSAGPRGARFGAAVHTALEHVDFSAWSLPMESVPPAQLEVVARVLRGEGFSTEIAREAAMRMLSAALRTPIVDDLCLANLPAEKRRAEMEFHFGIADADPKILLGLLHEHGYQRQRQGFAHVGTRLAGLMNGLIDLVFVHEDRWWIVDYKTNHLGDYAGDYAPARLPAAMAAHDYDLQYLIYSVALHRWLRHVRGSAYDYTRDFGGVRYLFLRGMGVGDPGNGIFCDRPPETLIAAMDELLHAPGIAAGVAAGVAA